MNINNNNLINLYIFVEIILYFLNSTYSMSFHNIKSFTWLSKTIVTLL